MDTSDTSKKQVLRPENVEVESLPMEELAEVAGGTADAADQVPTQTPAC